MYRRLLLRGDHYVAVGGFSQQIADLIGRRAPAAAHAAGVAPSSSIEIAGHSLGAALATLYTMENARMTRISNPSLCTFASPFVGDATFASIFNALNLSSWRIVNAPDIVPKLPPEILGFSHVDTLQQFSSTGNVKPTVGCWHALSTYLSLIDPTREPDAECLLTATVASPIQRAAETPATATALSIPAGPVTINITVTWAQESSQSASRPG